MSTSHCFSMKHTGSFLTSNCTWQTGARFKTLFCWVMSPVRKAAFLKVDCIFSPRRAKALSQGGGTWQIKSINQSHKMDWVSKIISAKVKIPAADWSLQLFLCQASLLRDAQNPSEQQVYGINNYQGNIVGIQTGSTVISRPRIKPTHQRPHDQLSSCKDALQRISPLL